MSGVNSTTAALGERMTPFEVGKRKTAEANIVDFLREAGNALDSTSTTGGMSSHMPRRKSLKPRFVGRLLFLPVEAECFGCDRLLTRANLTDPIHLHAHTTLQMLRRHCREHRQCWTLRPICPHQIRLHTSHIGDHYRLSEQELGGLTPQHAHLLTTRDLQHPRYHTSPQI